MRLTYATLKSYKANSNSVDTLTVEFVRNPDTGKEAVYLVLCGVGEIQALQLTPENARLFTSELGNALSKPRCSHPRGRLDPDDNIETSDSGDRECVICGGKYNKDTNQHGRASNV